MPSSVGSSLVLSFCVAAVVTALVRRLAVRTGAVDKPGARSLHGEPVPFLGGLAMYAAFVAGVWHSLGFGDRAVAGLVMGCGAAVALGVLDDVWKATPGPGPRWLTDAEGRGLRPWAKFAGQVAVSFVLIAFGVRIAWVHSPFGGYVYLGLWSAPVTMVWVVAIMNAVNFVDGLDGLAAGVSAIAALTLLIAALQTGQGVAAVLLTASLLGSALGFLPWNWAPAKIFMGDAGSLFLGCALAAVSVEGTLKSPTLIALAVPILALGLPVFDTCCAVVRRIRGRRPIGAADRQHLHHRLLELGLSPREAVVVMYIASGWLSVSALAVSQMGGAAAVGLLAFVGGSVLFLARRLGLLGAGSRGSEGAAVTGSRAVHAGAGGSREGTGS